MYAPHSPHGKLREFGGSRLKSNPKRARPIKVNQPIHLILKSKMATGSKYSMLIPKNARAAKEIIYSLAKRFKVKVDRYENVGNHLHIVAQFPSQDSYVSFIRGISSSIARFVLGVSKALIKGIKFWQARPYTRIISWGKDLRATYKYLNYNRIQAIGFDLFVKEQIKLSD
jgi:REP element-mobilizing transposase RayT